MKYFFLEETYVPKHCIYGPRQKEAVLLDDWEWYTITDSLHRWERDRKIAELYVAKEQNKRNLSYNMTKNWQNTLASIKTQSEQRRIEKREKDKQEKIDKYYEVLENRKKEKKEILDKAKRTLFEGKDAVKTLVVALEKCAVLTEREKQIEFKNRLKEERAKEEEEYAEKIRKDVEDYQNDMKEREKKKEEEKRNYCRNLAKQAEERRKLTEENEAKRKKAEEEDIMKMMKWNENMKECERKEKQDQVKRAKMYREKSYFQTELEKSLLIEEEEENEVNKIINKYGKRFAKERVAKEERMIAEKIAKRQRITEMLSKKMQEKELKEEEIFEKVIREEEEELLKKEKEMEEKKRRAQSEMAAWEAEEMARAASEENAKRVQLKWTILQNERRRDIDNEWACQRKRVENERKMKTREEYAMQVKEKEEIKEEGRKRDKILVAGKDGDEEVLKYCDEAIEYVKSCGWNDYAIIDAVTKLKKELGSKSTLGEEGKDVTPQQKCGRPTGLFCYCFKN